MANKIYAEPAVEIVKLDMNDIIATSGTGGSTGGGAWGSAVRDLEDDTFAGFDL